MKPLQKEFEGNILITISDNEVRLWVCNDKGENIFRFKAIGRVYHSGGDVIIASRPAYMPPQKEEI